jgi:hypothetical protein
MDQGQLSNIQTRLHTRKFLFDLDLLRFSGKDGATVDGSSMATSEESVGGEIP